MQNLSSLMHAKAAVSAGKQYMFKELAPKQVVASLHVFLALPEIGIACCNGESDA